MLSETKNWQEPPLNPGSDYQLRSEERDSTRCVPLKETPRSSERSREGAAFGAINISPPNGVKTEALCIRDKCIAPSLLFSRQEIFSRPLKGLVLPPLQGWSIIFDHDPGAAL